MTGEIPSSIIAGISFIGRSGGAVKSLGGFRKGHHTLPTTANATTSAFLGKICSGELTARAEKLYQAVRTGLGYKRKDATLNITGPVALLAAREFVVELAYALEPAAPARYAVTMTLHGLRNAGLARTTEFTAIFAGEFSEISFALKGGAQVEAVIDVIEALVDGEGLTVSYPSDCRECVIRVADVDASVRCTGAALDLIFARAGSPAELIDGFGVVRGAFAISKVLAGLIG